MATDVFYCEGWFRARKRAIVVLSESEALARHNSGKLYTVLLGSIETPECFIEVVGENNFAGVNFLDENLRVILVYAFQRGDDGALFLSSANSYRYVEQSDKAAAAEQYYFNRDGTVYIHDVDVSSGSERIAEKSVDLRGNYEAWPEFGNYQHLIQRERGHFQ